MILSKGGYGGEDKSSKAMTAIESEKTLVGHGLYGINMVIEIHLLDGRWTIFTQSLNCARKELILK